MTVKGLNLAWIVVADLKKALHFYTEVVGLKLEELNEAFGWAELSGEEGGARLGIAQMNEKDPVQPGQNAVVTLTVENLAKSVQDLLRKGARVIGDLMEIPEVVKLQMVQDPDGNYFQLVEVLH